MKLQNWSLVSIYDNPYLPPELQTKGLHGLVYGHPNHKDGTEVTTSAFLFMFNGLALTASGSEYQLGEIDPVYEEMFPNARCRMECKC